MKIYHNNSQIEQKFTFEWDLSHVVPSCVSSDGTMCYSPYFDGKNWSLLLADSVDKFLVGLKLLSIPFGIGMLAVQCKFIVRNKKRGVAVSDTIVEAYKYSDDDMDENLGQSKEWKKSELFGPDWQSEYSLTELSVEVVLEIIHME